MRSPSRDSCRTDGRPCRPLPRRCGTYPAWRQRRSCGARGCQLAFARHDDRAAADVETGNRNCPRRSGWRWSTTSHGFTKMFAELGAEHLVGLEEFFVGRDGAAALDLLSDGGNGVWQVHGSIREKQKLSPASRYSGLCPGCLRKDWCRRAQLPPARHARLARARGGERGGAGRLLRRFFLLFFRLRGGSGRLGWFLRMRRGRWRGRMARSRCRRRRSGADAAAPAGCGGGAAGCGGSAGCRCFRRVQQVLRAGRPGARDFRRRMRRFARMWGGSRRRSPGARLQASDAAVAAPGCGGGSWRRRRGAAASGVRCGVSPVWAVPGVGAPDGLPRASGVALRLDAAGFLRRVGAGWASGVGCRHPARVAAGLPVSVRGALPRASGCGGSPGWAGLPVSARDAPR